MEIYLFPTTTSFFFFPLNVLTVPYHIAYPSDTLLGLDYLRNCSLALEIILSTLSKLLIIHYFLSSFTIFTGIFQIYLFILHVWWTICTLIWFYVMWNGFNRIYNNVNRNSWCLFMSVFHLQTTLLITKNVCRFSKNFKDPLKVLPILKRLWRFWRRFDKNSFTSPECFWWPAENFADPKEKFVVFPRTIWRFFKFTLKQFCWSTEDWWSLKNFIGKEKLCQLEYVSPILTGLAN